MKFAHVELLLLIWIVPLLAAVYLYGWRKRRKILNGYCGQRTLNNIVPAGMGRRRKIGAVLVLSAALCTIVALSGPQYGFQWQEIERRGIDIVIALDCSRSMLAADVAPTRLDRAKREIYDLLTMLQGDRIGLVAFSGTAFLQCPLTIDYPAVYLFLDVLSPDYLPVGGSDLAAALQTAQGAFDPQSDADTAVILITDGEHTGAGDPMDAVKEAQKAGIKLFTIGVGSGEGVPVPADQGGFKKDTAGQIILSRLDEFLLTRMALSTGGSYVRSVAGDMDLETIYLSQIRSAMDRATVERGRKQIWADRYQWPLVFAIILLLAAKWIAPVRHPLVLTVACLGLLIHSPGAQAGPLQKGYQAYQHKAYEKALKQFIDGQLKDPDNPSVLYNIGNAYYKTGNFDAAAEHYLQALPKASPELKHSLLYNLGNAAYRMGALEKAVEHYKAALQVNADDRQTQENLAFVQQQLRQQQNPDSNEAQKEKEPSNNDPNEPQPENQKDAEQSQQQGGAPQQEHLPPQQSGSQSEHQPQAREPAASQPQNQAPPPAPQSPDQKDAGKASSGAAQMLNRLKDQPGKAMMPDYQKRPVEKDW
jgi:Ca-activated chloride channel family protein